jgi:hypothetical protein
MIDLDRLARQARRAGELGRLRRAVRGSIVVIPLAAVAAVVGRSGGACACLGALLFVASIALRWWRSETGRAAHLGLSFGLLPLAASLLTVRFGGSLGRLDSFDPCGPLCLAAGLAAGVAAAYHAVRVGGQARLGQWAAVAVIASLTAALGCVPLGIGSTFAIVLAVITGTIVGLLRRPAVAT